MALIGAAFFVAELVAVVRNQAHHPTWELVAGALAAFLAAALLEVVSLQRRLSALNDETHQRFESIRYALVCADVITQDRATPPSLRVGVRFWNGGPEALRFAVATMVVVVDGHTLAEPTFSTAGAVLIHDQSSFYWYPWLSDVRLAHGTKGEIAYVVHFGHPTDGPRFQMTHKQEFECLNTPGGGFVAHLLDIEPPTVTDRADSSDWETYSAGTYKSCTTGSGKIGLTMSRSTTTTTTAD